MFSPELHFLLISTTAKQVLAFGVRPYFKGECGVKSKVTDDSEEEGPAGCSGFATSGVLCARTHGILGLLAERGDTSYEN